MGIRLETEVSELLYCLDQCCLDLIDQFEDSFRRFHRARQRDIDSLVQPDVHQVAMRNMLLRPGIPCGRSQQGRIYADSLEIRAWSRADIMWHRIPVLQSAVPAISACCRVGGGAGFSTSARQGSIRYM